MFVCFFGWINRYNFRISLVEKSNSKLRTTKQTRKEGMGREERREGGRKKEETNKEKYPNTEQYNKKYNIRKGGKEERNRVK